MAGWARSLIVDDHVIIRSDLNGHESLESVDGRLFWGSFMPEAAAAKKTALRLIWPKWEARIYSGPGNSLFCNPHGGRGWQWFGFGSVASTRRFPLLGNALLKVWMIPYCSIVAPLTLLSAYLLLSKPRTAKKPEPVRVVNA
jgi:hypothetical protein